MTDTTATITPFRGYRASTYPRHHRGAVTVGRIHGTQEDPHPRQERPLVSTLCNVLLIAAEAWSPDQWEPMVAEAVQSPEALLCRRCLKKYARMTEPHLEA